MNIPQINNIKFYNSFKSTISEKKDDTMQNEIQSLIQCTKDARDYEEASKILKNASIDEKINQVDPITYKSGDYVISEVLKKYADNYTGVLQKLTEKGISIAPKFVDSVDKGNFTILFTEIPGMNGQELVPYYQGEKMLAPEAKQDAYKDVQRLLKVGIVNNKMLRSTSSWFVTPESKKIIIPDWSSLSIVGDEERAPILNKFHNMLFKP
ncbi:hypothetical protein IJ182_02335 [bacterium]|nr:hypothetical protein [bacterium]